MEPVITPNTAKKEATHFVITENTETIKYCTQDGTQNSVTYTPKTKDIIIKCVTLVNLPRWDITFNVFNKSYSREMLAHSGAILEDSIQYCPKHTSPFKRETVAACEVCGQALCNSHVSQCPVCGKWLCQDDGVSCSSCGKTFCPEHISLVCGICNKPLCSDCKEICSICGTVFGNKHIVTCSQCGKAVCSNCSTTIGVIRRKQVCKKCEK